MSENKTIRSQNGDMQKVFEEETLHKLESYVKWFREQNLREPRIYYLGSSFNPLHNGHIGMILYGIYNFDYVVLAPVAKHAFDRKSSMLSYETRCEILQQWIDLSGYSDRIMISFLDKELLDSTGSNSYAIDIIGKIVQNILGIDIYWAAGLDTVNDFLAKKWKGGHGLLDMVKFVVFQREECAALEIPERLVDRFILTTELFGNASSTEIRKVCAEDFEAVQERLQEILPDSVIQKVYDSYKTPDLGKRKPSE